MRRPASRSQAQRQAPPPGEHVGWDANMDRRVASFPPFVFSGRYAWCRRRARELPDMDAFLWLNWP